MNAAEFKQEMTRNRQSIIKISEDDIVSVTQGITSYHCQFVRLLEADSDASELLAEFRASSFTEIVAKARATLKERKAKQLH